MGYYVTLAVIFHCDNNDAVAQLTRTHLAPLQAKPPSESARDAESFLNDLSQRSGDNPGPKGGLSCWGIVGNHTHAGEFVEALRPFWADLLHGVEGGPTGLKHILVFYEPEQTEHASAYEIFREDGRLVIRHHEDLPFAWMQM